VLGGEHLGQQHAEQVSVKPIRRPETTSGRVAKTMMGKVALGREGRRGVGDQVIEIPVAADRGGQSEILLFAGQLIPNCRKLDS
jgi:hypothetical protein